MRKNVQELLQLPTHTLQKFNICPGHAGLARLSFAKEQFDVRNQHRFDVS